MCKKIWLLMVAAVFVTAGMAIQVAAAEKGFTDKGKEFVKKAGSGGMMEVQLGQMALERAKSLEVKEFGARMTAEHSNANDQLKLLAQAEGVLLPANLLPEHKSTVEKLKKKSGAEFDKAYMQEMVKDHVKDIAEFKKALTYVKDPELKQWIETVLPTLQAHLQLARQVAGKVGVDVKKIEKEAEKSTS